MSLGLEGGLARQVMLVGNAGGFVMLCQATSTGTGLDNFARSWDSAGGGQCQQQQALARPPKGMGEGGRACGMMLA